MAPRRQRADSALRMPRVPAGAARLCRHNAPMLTPDRQSCSSTAWLMLAVGDDRQHGGNDGYDDEPAAHYSWDSTVPNAASPSEGDVIALWDKRTLLGVSVIEHIEQGTAEKYRYSCPLCGMASLKARKTLSPKFKCFKCGGIFDEPAARLDSVTTYRSRHDVAWVELSGALHAAQLRELCVSPGSQLSIRPLRWGAFRHAVAASPRGEDLTFLERRRQAMRLGRRVVTPRTRVGEAAFRSELVKLHGSVCAFTGACPQAALESCYLDSYEEVGARDVHGGLLLRRDLPRLLDLGHVAVHPTTMRLDVSAVLAEYPTYAQLHGSRLSTEVPARTQAWFRQHWAAHRPEIEHDNFGCNIP